MTLPSHSFYIAYRTDLNMRKGKLAAQASHALMAYWLQFFRRMSPGCYVLHASMLPLYRAFIAAPRVELLAVGSEVVLEAFAEKAGGRGVRVIDSGRTEFKGVPTFTCFGYLDADLPEIPEQELPGIRQIEQTNPAVKQVIIANASLKMDKSQLAAYSAIGAWLSVDTAFSVKTLDEVRFHVEDQDLDAWLTGKFAKIGLKAPHDLFLVKRDALSAFSTALMLHQGEPALLSVAPTHSAKIDVFTGDLSLN